MNMVNCYISKSGKADKRIFFVASNLNHLRMWTAIIDSLRQLEPKIAVEICSLDAYYDQIDRIELVSSKTVFLVFPRKLSNKVYWDCNFIEKIILYLEARFQTNAFLRENSPKIIVFGNDIGVLEQILLTESMRRRIPTLLVQDGILRDVVKNKFGLTRKFQYILRKLFRFAPHSVYGLGGAKKFAVMGPYTRQLLEKLDVAPAAIVETGHPRFDKLYKIRSEISNKSKIIARRKIGIKQDSPVIGFISQPMIRYQYVDAQKWQKVVRDVISVVKNLGSQFEFVIKLHPSEIKAEFIALYNDLIKESKIIIFHREDIYDLLPLMDMVIVYNSTVSLEAMVLDIPTIIYHPFDFRDDFHFVELGGATVASNTEDLKQTILKEAQDREWRSNSLQGREKAVRYHIGSLDGHADYRIAKLIQDMGILRK